MVRQRIIPTRLGAWRLGVAVPLAMASSRCGGRLAVVAIITVGFVRMACAMPVVMLRGEVGDTVANPMRAFGQRVLTALHLGLDLLAERPIGGCSHRPTTDSAHPDDRRENHRGRFASDRSCK